MISDVSDSHLAIVHYVLKSFGDLFRYTLEMLRRIMSGVMLCHGLTFVPRTELEHTH